MRRSPSSSKRAQAPPLTPPRRALAEARKPCRVQITFSGAELFLYNRTPSYDAILEQLGLKEQDPLRRGPSEPSDSSSSSSPPSSLDKKEKHSLSPSSPRPSTAVSSIEQVQAEQGEKERERRKQVDEGKKDGTNWLLEALPIAIECSRGAIVMGNPSTPSILVAGFDGVDGTYSAGKARSKLDDYKEVYHFVFRRPKIVWRTNPDFKEGMADHGQHLMDRLDQDMCVLLPLRLAVAQHASSSRLTDALVLLAAATSRSRASSPARPPSSPCAAFGTSSCADLTLLDASDDTPPAITSSRRRMTRTPSTSRRAPRPTAGPACLGTRRPRTTPSTKTARRRTSSSTPRWRRSSCRTRST